MVKQLLKVSFSQTINTDGRQTHLNTGLYLNLNDPDRIIEETMISASEASEVSASNIYENTLSVITSKSVPSSKI